MEPPALPGVRHEYVDVPGVRVHVATAGDPAAPPLVLLHGWPQHWWCWRHVIEPLAQTHRLLMPDMRGFGWSSVPAGGYDKEQIAGDLLALLDVLGVTRAGLVGHDWGAWVGFLAALRAPERFDGFLALSIVPPFHQAPPAATAMDAWRFSYQVVLSTPMVGTSLLRATPAVVGDAVWRGAVQRENITDAARAIYGRVLQEPGRARASALLYRTFLMQELPAVMRGRYARAQLTVPTVLLSGEHDPAIRPRLLAGADASPHSLTMEILDDTGHFVPEERPGLVVDAASELFG